MMASSALQATLLADGVDEADVGGSGGAGVAAAAAAGFVSVAPLLFYDHASSIERIEQTAATTTLAAATMLANVTLFPAMAFSAAGPDVLDEGSGLMASGGSVSDDAFSLHLRHNIYITVVLSLLAAIVGVVTVLGNLLVLVAFFVDRSLRQPGNYLIVSLALADLLIGLFSMPLYTMYLLLDESWPLGWITCDLWLSLDYTVCLVSQYTVFYITLDRFLVVKFTATYRLWLTNKRAKLIVAGIWVGSWLLFFPSITGWQFFVGERTVPPNNCYAQFMENPLFNTILVILYYWVTLVVISVLYTFIYRKAWQMETRRKAEHKRAQMVHVKLAQAAMGLSSAPGMSKSSSSKGRGGGGKASDDGKMRTSETTDDDDINDVSTSSHSLSMHRKPSAKNLAKNLKSLRSKTDAAVAGAKNSSNINNNNINSSNNNANCQPLLLNHKIGLVNSNSDGPVGGANNTNHKMFVQASRGRNDSKSRSFFRRKHSNRLSVAVAMSPGPEQMPLTRSPSDDRCGGAVSQDERSCSPARGDNKVDPDDLLTMSPTTRMRRCYSDLEPILSVSGLLHVPVNELVGIEFIDDDDPAPEEYNKQRQNGPFSGNAIYRLRLGPSLSRKSTTFENLTSARTEKTIRQRIDRILKRTRQSIGSHLSLTGSWRRKKSHQRVSVAGDDDNVQQYNDVKRKKKHWPGGRKPFAGLNRLGRKWSNMPSSTGGSVAEGAGPAASVTTVSHSNANAPGKSGKIVYQSRAHKALRMISFILGVFVITWTPYHIFAIMKGFCNECVNDTLYAISYWFCYLNSPINPICYAVANQHFKRAFAKILHGNFKRS